MLAFKLCASVPSPYLSQDFIVGISRYLYTGIVNGGPGGSGVSVQLYILPLSRNAPIYVVWPPFPPGQNSTLVLEGVDIIQMQDALLQVKG